MRAVLLSTVVAAIASLSHAFVQPTPAIASKSRPRAASSRLQMMDPAHSIWEAASSFLVSVDDAVPAAGEVSYSKASYYTVLALYAMSFPGLWSQIKRSTTAKVKRKTFVRYVWNNIWQMCLLSQSLNSCVSPGENAVGGKDLRQEAGEIMACKYDMLGLHLYYDKSNTLTSLCSDMKANNYDVVEAGETITFRGLVQRSTSQAFFLVFCTALGMASLALVLQIQFQDLGK